MKWMTQAENLTEHLLQSNSFGLQKSGNTQEIFSNEKLNEAFENIMKNGDKEWGGFGKAPKFPQTFSIQFSASLLSFLSKRCSTYSKHC